VVLAYLILEARRLSVPGMLLRMIGNIGTGA
jgi:hypothetical protein